MAGIPRATARFATEKKGEAKQEERLKEGEREREERDEEGREDEEEPLRGTRLLMQSKIGIRWVGGSTASSSGEASACSPTTPTSPTPTTKKHQ